MSYLLLGAIRYSRLAATTFTTTAGLVGTAVVDHTAAAGSVKKFEQLREYIA